MLRIIDSSTPASRLHNDPRHLRAGDMTNRQKGLVSHLWLYSGTWPLCLLNSRLSWVLKGAEANMFDHLLPCLSSCFRPCVFQTFSIKRSDVVVRLFVQCWTLLQLLVVTLFKCHALFNKLFQYLIGSSIDLSIM